MFISSGEQLAEVDLETRDEGGAQRAVELLDMAFTENRDALRFGVFQADFDAAIGQIGFHLAIHLFGSIGLRDDFNGQRGGAFKVVVGRLVGTRYAHVGPQPCFLAELVASE